MNALALGADRFAGDYLGRRLAELEAAAGGQDVAEPETAVSAPHAVLELGRLDNGSTLYLDLPRLLSSRLLIQGSSGAGKSKTLRKLVEEAFEFVTTHIVDPEGEFGNLAQHIGATTVKAAEIATDGLTAIAVRSRKHRLAVHLDLTDLDPDERIMKASAFFAGLTDCPREDWANTVMVAIDEAHLLAPHLAASSRDAEVRRLGIATLTDLCSRGRKRGIAPVIATQKLSKLAGSVTSELHNVLIGLSVFDRDIARAADFLGFSAGEGSDRLRTLLPGEFYALGPALSRSAVLARISETATVHLGATPELVGPSDEGAGRAAELLDLEGLRDAAGPAKARQASPGNSRGLDAFLMEPAAPAAARIIGALRPIAPNATTADNLAAHLALSGEEVNAGLDLLSILGAVDTMPRGHSRVARLSARLRLRVIDVPVVGLA